MCTLHIVLSLPSSWVKDGLGYSGLKSRLISSFFPAMHFEAEGAAVQLAVYYLCGVIS